MPYFYKKGSDTYHTSKECIHVPENVEENPDWIVINKEPSGLEKCDDCIIKKNKNIFAKLLNRPVVKILIAPIIVGIVVLIFGIIINSPNGNRPTGINVKASIDNPNPPLYSTVILTVKVRDKNNKAVPGASIEATAHYRTTDTTRTSYTDDYGEAKIPFRISRATIGYEVIVDVRVRKGKSIGVTQTSFTPVE